MASRGARAKRGTEPDEAQAVGTSRRAGKAPRRESDEIVAVEQPSATGRRLNAGAGKNRQTRWTKGEDDYDPEVERITKEYAAAASKLTEESAVAKELSAEETGALVAVVMRHMLFKPTDAGPTARTELVALINSKYKGKRNLTTLVIAMAQAKFPTTLGMEMRELGKKRKADPKKKLAAGGAVAADKAGDKTFVLRSLLPGEMRRRHVDSGAQRARHAFTMTALALVVTHSQSDQIYEGQLWEHLNALGMEKGVMHPTFGDPEVQLQHLVKTRYLTKEKVRSNDGADEVQYEIAENAHDEIGKEKILSFIADAMNAPDARGVVELE